MITESPKRMTVAKAKHPITSKTILAGAVVALTGLLEVVGYVQDKGIPTSTAGWVTLGGGVAVIVFRWIGKQPISTKGEKEVEAP